MKKNEEKNENSKREYIPPVMEVITIEIECGIAANSVAVTPVTTGGNTDPVATDWNGNDTPSINAPF